MIPALVNFQTGIAVFEKRHVVELVVRPCHIGSLVSRTGNGETVKFVITAGHAQPHALVDIGEFRELEVYHGSRMARRLEHNGLVRHS